MKYKFNPYERAVGMFISFAVAGSFVIGVGMAIKKNWLEEKISYTTYTQSASNLRVGSNVLMSGLKVGKVEKIELDKTHNIKINFTVLKEYNAQMTAGTKVQFIRPFIIGDKALALLQGPPGGKLLSYGEVLPVHESLDLFEVLNGKELERMLVKVDSILNNLDQTLIMGKDIAYQVGDKKKLKKTVDDLNFAMSEVRKVMPHFTANAPQVSQNMNRIIENLSTITTAFKELQPEGAKTIELLHESVITLKAMQKSMLLRGNVEEVKEEMAIKEKEKENNETRMPASKK